jgi:hypothetical protein
MPRDGALMRYIVQPGAQVNAQDAPPLRAVRFIDQLVEEDFI